LPDVSDRLAIEKVSSTGLTRRYSVLSLLPVTLRSSTLLRRLDESYPKLYCTFRRSHLDSRGTASLSSWRNDRWLWDLDTRATPYYRIPIPVRSALEDFERFAGDGEHTASNPNCRQWRD